MGSFKSAAARTKDQRTITVADRPEDIKPEDWLQDGESITFWTVMPHGAAADIADAATTAEVMQGLNRRQRRRAQVRASYHPGRAALATFVLGLIVVNVRDEEDKPVTINLPTPGQDGWEDRAKALMSGLPSPLVDWLQTAIGADAPESLEDLPDDAETEEDTLGNG